MDELRPIHVLVVDDEEPARRRIAELLRIAHPNASIAEAADGVVALGSLTAKNFDLMFLDIQMPGMNGLQLVQELGVTHMPFTIFVTTYDQHAIRAFEVNALDYLLKPYSDSRFYQALERAGQRRLLASMSEFGEGLLKLLPIQQPQKRYIDRLAVKAEGSTRLIPVAQIESIEGAGVYVTLHVEGREYLHRTTLTQLAMDLDPHDFLRVHRSTIANVNAIMFLEATSHGDFEAKLLSGRHIQVSRTYRKSLESRLQQLL